MTGVPTEKNNRLFKLSLLLFQCRSLGKKVPCLTQGDQQVVGIDSSAHCNCDALNRTVYRSGDLNLHLHRFQYNQYIASFYRLPNLALYFKNRAGHGAVYRSLTSRHRNRCSCSRGRLSSRGSGGRSRGSRSRNRGSRGGSRCCNWSCTHICDAERIRRHSGVFRNGRHHYRYQLTLIHCRSCWCRSCCGSRGRLCSRCCRRLFFSTLQQIHQLGVNPDDQSQNCQHQEHYHHAAHCHQDCFRGSQGIKWI